MNQVMNDQSSSVDQGKQVNDQLSLLNQQWQSVIVDQKKGVNVNKFLFYILNLVQKKNLTGDYYEKNIIIIISISFSC